VSELFRAENGPRRRHTRSRELRLARLIPTSRR